MNVFIKKSIFNMNTDYDFVLLDLDNSLMDENVYLYSAFDQIAKQSQDSQYRLDWIWNRFLTVGRYKLLTSYCNNFNLNNQLSNYLDIMRNIKIDLRIFNKVEKFISQFNAKIYIVTNGNPIQQNNKIQNLKLTINYSTIFASEYDKPKPSTNCVTDILKPEHKVLVVGDSIIDYQFSKKLNADFMQVKFSRNIDGFIEHETVKLDYKN